MNRLLKSAATGLIALLFGTAVQADVLTVKYDDFQGASDTGTIAVADVRDSVRVRAGEFRFSNHSPDLWEGDILGFCVDVSKNLIQNSKVDYTLHSLESLAGHSNAHYASLASLTDILGTLYDTYYDDYVAEGDHAAAFQLALWAIIYNNDSARFNRDGNSFTASGFSASTMSALDAILLDLDFGQHARESSFYGFFVLLPDDPSNNQAILTWRPKPVPEPGSLALIAIGLLLVLGMRQRRLATRAI